jgi:hypothetical protein
VDVCKKVIAHHVPHEALLSHWAQQQLPQVQILVACVLQLETQMELTQQADMIGVSLFVVIITGR